MKYFIYKTLILFSFIFIVYHATIGYSIRYLKIELISLFDKDKIETLKNKIRNEIKSSLGKEKILNTEDADLISRFIEKVNSEIKNKVK